MRNSPTAFLIAWLAFCQFCIGAGTWNGVAFSAWNGVAITAWNGTGIGIGGGGPSYLINQNFEGAGYDNSESWTEAGTGTIDEDYATSPAPLVGSQSMRFNLSSQTGRSTSPTFAAQADVWGYFQYHAVTTLPAAGKIFFIGEDSAGTDLITIEVSTGNPVRVRCGTANATTVTTLAADTTYHFWWRYTKGTGANAFVSVGFSTDGTEATSGNAFASTSSGTRTTDMEKVVIGAENSSTYNTIYDRVLVDDADIGSNP